MSSCCTRPASRSLAPPARSIAARCTAVRTLRTIRVRTRDAPPPAPAADGASPAAPKRMRTIESMPFQTFQLALDVIRKDRAEKLSMIAAERAKVARVMQFKGLTPQSIEVISMMSYIEKLKIMADINSPRVKYNFDTGIIGMNKPIYRYLLERKWREMRRPILMQRLTQMYVIPDVLPGVDPSVDVQVRFAGRDTRPGVFVKSHDSQRSPTLKIVPFQRGEQLCTVVVVDPDVPDVAKDGFRYRLHWILANVAISPTQTQAVGTGAAPSDEIVPYLPPHVQKGSPYHRYSMFVFRQPENARIDPATLVGKVEREGFNLRSFQTKLKLKTIGAFMWRGEWDEGTKEVMQKHGITGWDVMYTRVKD